MTGPNFYTWLNGRFYRLDEDERLSFADDNVWVPYNISDETITNFFEEDPWTFESINSNKYNMLNKKKAFYDGLD